MVDASLCASLGKIYCTANMTPAIILSRYDGFFFFREKVLIVEIDNVTLLVFQSATVLIPKLAASLLSKAKELRLNLETVVSVL